MKTNFNALSPSNYFSTVFLSFVAKKMRKFHFHPIVARTKENDMQFSAQSNSNKLSSIFRCFLTKEAAAKCNFSWKFVGKGLKFGISVV
jgi:hypothetical protein